MKPILKVYKNGKVIFPQSLAPFQYLVMHSIMIFKFLNYLDQRVSMKEEGMNKEATCLIQRTENQSHDELQRTRLDKYR